MHNHCLLQIQESTFPEFSPGWAISCLYTEQCVHFCISCFLGAYCEHLSFTSRSRPPWFDLPPPPYSSDSQNHIDLPPYRSRTGSVVSTDASTGRSPGNTDNSRTRRVGTATDHHRTLCETTDEQRDSLMNSASVEEL